MNIEQSLTIPNKPDTADSEVFQDVDSTLHVSSITEGKSAFVDYGQYSNLDWEQKNPPDLGNPESWGTKTLPGAGAFYFANHEDGNPTMGHLEPAQHDD